MEKSKITLRNITRRAGERIKALATISLTISSQCYLEHQSWINLSMLMKKTSKYPHPEFVQQHVMSWECWWVMPMGAEA